MSQINLETILPRLGDAIRLKNRRDDACVEGVLLVEDRIPYLVDDEGRKVRIEEGSFIGFPNINWVWKYFEVKSKALHL